MRENKSLSIRHVENGFTIEVINDLDGTVEKTFIYRDLDGVIAGVKATFPSNPKAVK